jgi:hypothetical protein
MAKVQIQMPEVVRRKVQDRKAIYKHLSDNGIIPIVGAYITDGRIIECAIDLMCWIEKKMEEERSEGKNVILDVMKGFFYKSEIPKPGRPTTLASVTKSIGHERFSEVMNIMASEGHVGPTDDQILDRIRQLQIEGRLGPSSRTRHIEKMKKMDEVRRDKQLNKLDERSREFLPGRKTVSSKDIEQDDLLREFLHGEGGKA